MLSIEILVGKIVWNDYSMNTALAQLEKEIWQWIVIIRKL